MAAPKAGPSVERGDGDRHAEDIGHHLPPEGALGAAAGEPDLGGTRAGRVDLAQQIERVAQAEGDPSSTAREISAFVVRAVRPINAPRARASACGVRSPIRYGRKTRPPAPGRAVLAVSVMISYGSTSRISARQLLAVAERVAVPAQRAAGREHHAHRVVLARHRVAEAVEAHLLLHGVARGVREHDAARADRRHGAAGPHHAEAHRAGRVVGRAARHRDAAGEGRAPRPAPP